MKTKIILIILSCISLNIIAQETDFQKLNLKMYYSPILYGKNPRRNFYYNLWGINPNFRMTELWEVGCYANYTRINVLTEYTFDEETGTGYGIGTLSPVLFFGLNGNFHVLPLFMNTRNFRYDLYLTGKIGGFHVAEQNVSYSKAINPEYSIGAGFSVNLSKHFGIFAEYDYGKFITYNHRWEYGIEIMF
ncbi:hypothetical protein ACE01N_14540 [Saccharicrinis sp. FJH2]|uniref:hypothetical protein n=1 Tax=Saccharicrinis sp. FJH65 TaxID=3344659 RepID=UPI0035F40ABC